MQTNLVNANSATAETTTVLKLQWTSIPIESDFFDILSALNKSKGEWVSLNEIKRFVSTTMLTVPAEKDYQYEQLKTLDFISQCQAKSIQYILLC